MKHLLTPKLDLVFKLLFTKDTDILADLINAVLNYPKDRHICSVEVINPVILPDTIKQKLIILDLHAKDERGNQYDIEMQVREYSIYPKRTLYYVSKMYADQLEPGDDYGMLKPVIGIHFLNYNMFPDYKSFHFCFEFRDRRYSKLRLSEDMIIHLFELPKFDKIRDNLHDVKKLAQWLNFFNHAHEEKGESMKNHYTNPKIHRAFEVLESLSADVDVRILAEEREKALKDHVSILASIRREGQKNGLEKGEKIGLKKGEKIGLKKGEKIGLKKGEKVGIEKGLKKGEKIGLKKAKVEAAKNLLAMGNIEIYQIAKATGLSIDEVKALENQISD